MHLLVSKFHAACCGWPIKHDYHVLFPCPKVKLEDASQKHVPSHRKMGRFCLGQINLGTKWICFPRGFCCPITSNFKSFIYLFSNFITFLIKGSFCLFCSVSRDPKYTQKFFPVTFQEHSKAILQEAHETSKNTWRRDLTHIVPCMLSQHT